MIEFKFKHITSKDNKTTVNGVYYVGSINSRQEPDSTGTGTISVTRFRRSAVLKSYTHTFDGILTVAECAELMKVNLVGQAQGAGRTPIPQQTL